MKLVRRLILPAAIGAAVLLLGAVGAAEVRTAWTLERCREEAIASSHGLSASAREVDRSAAAAEETRAARRPTLDFGGSYLYTSETMNLDLPSFGVFNPPEVRFGDGNAYDLKLQLSAPLFTGGALLYRARAQEAALVAAMRDLDADELRLTHEVRRAYYAALGSEAQAGAARVAEGRLRRHVDEVDAAAQAGGASEENRVQALSRLRQAEQVRILAEGLASVDRLNLGRLVGMPGREVAPSDDIESSLMTGEARSDTTVDARPELAALSERVLQSDRMAKAARGAYFPALAAQAAYHHAKPGIDAIANEWMQYGNVAVTLSWPLWEWGARADRVRQARAAGAALDERRAELRQALRAGLEAARVRLRSAEEQRARAGERVELESRRLDFVVSRYREGTASESERLDAEDDLAAAEIDLASAKAGVRLVEADVLYFLAQ